MSADEDHARPKGPRARLACPEVTEDLVALHRGELSPLRAESVRAHLESCPECRELSLEYELAARSFQRLPELDPPAGLVDCAMKEVLAAHGWIERPSGAWERPSEGSGLDFSHIPVPERASVWSRPVRGTLAWTAVAAAVLVTFVLGLVEPLNDAVGRAHRTILGRRISRGLESATDRFLEKLRL